MNILRRFFDAAIEAPSGGEAVVDTPASPVNLAETMAKAGRLVMPTDDGQNARVIERTQKPTTETQPSPAPATEAKTSEPAKQESPTPQAATTSAQPQTEPPKAVSESWQEVLKKQQPDQILKELGYGEQLVKFLNGRKDLDPKMAGLVNHWEKNGDIQPYMAALSTDFTKMPPEEVMRHHLREQNPELNAQQLERLYKIKVIDRYKIDPQNYSEDEVSDGQIELLADAKPIREKLVQSQSEYLIPKAPEPQPDTSAEQAQAQRQQEFEAYKSQLTENQLTKRIFDTKKIAIGEGEDEYLHEVNPNEIVDTLLYPEKWANNFYTAVKNPDGTVEYKPDIEKQLLIATFSRDPKGFLKDYAKHFKSLGGKNAVAPIENAKQPDGSSQAKSEADPTNPAAAMAKKGRVVSGSDA